MGQGGRMFGPPGGPTQAEPDTFPRLDIAAVGSPLADSIEDGPPLPSERDNLASPAQAEPSCLAPLQLTPF